MAQAWGVQRDSGRDKQGVENVLYGQSMLLSREDFSVALESIVGHIDKPWRIAYRRWR
jgi:hypothetical protein